MRNYERTLQKRLTWAGIASLASIPLTGPVGVLGAIGIFSGKGLRFIKKEAREEYFQEENKPVPPRELNNSFVDEGPETSIARQVPETAGNLLRTISQEGVYQTSLDRGYALAQHMVNLLPEGALDNSTGIRVTLERKTPGFFRRGEDGYQLNINLKR